MLAMMSTMNTMKPRKIIVHQNSRTKVALFLIVLVSAYSKRVGAFMSSACPRNPTSRYAKEDTGDDMFLDDLTPPQLDFARDSILFGEKPSTKKNNGVLMLWKGTKSILPKVVTGAWKDSVGEENPVGALYNVAFVRIPVILAFAVYLRNELEGRPLLVDLGYGQLAMSPLVIVGFMVIFLGPILNEK
mmetsp:Transcript_32383/g.64176  ORF Transcript_32383/g.64176 Transcript_32383/m.64176 type:complete len:188 (+) Transcript_32383:43-606(+)